LWLSLGLSVIYPSFEVCFEGRALLGLLSFMRKGRAFSGMKLFFTSFGRKLVKRQKIKLDHWADKK
jgi:hypothetical protein